jgi:uncharacterized protein (DUF58 family)
MKRSIKLFGWGLAFLFLVVTPSLLRAQIEVGLKMDVDKRELEVGDSLTLTLDFKQVGTSNSAVVQEPSIPSSENFEIQGDFSSNRVEMIGNNVTAISTTTYRMVATKAGTVQLERAAPGDAVEYRDSGSERKNAIFAFWKKKRACSDRFRHGSRGGTLTR